MDEIQEKESKLAPRKINYKALILGAVLLYMAVSVIGVGVIAFGIYANLKVNNQNFDKLERLIRLANPELAASEPVNIVLPSNAPFLGSKDAPVTVVEYADFQCPFCKQFQDSIFPEFKTKFIDTGKVKFYYQNFAFLGQESQDAAEAAKCAMDQGKFWEYHDTLYAKQAGENVGVYSVDNLKKFGADLGLDTGKFNSCFDSHIYKTEVEVETQAGQSYYVSATPTVFINGKRSEGVGTIAGYEAAIKDALESGQK